MQVGLGAAVVPMCVQQLAVVAPDCRLHRAQAAHLLHIGQRQRTVDQLLPGYVRSWRWMLLAKRSRSGSGMGSYSGSAAPRMAQLDFEFVVSVDMDFRQQACLQPPAYALPTDR